MARRKNTAPFSRFKIARVGVSNVTLPFDVPFIIWGDVERAKTAVSVRMAEAPKDMACDAIPASLYGRAIRAETANWLASDYTERGQTAPNGAESDALVQFEMLMPAILPSRDYCLLIQTEPGRELLPGELAAIRAAMVPVLERFLRDNHDQGLALNAEDVRPLRLGLSQAIAGADPLGAFKAKPGTIFDSDAPETVDADFLELYTNSNAPASDITTQLRNFQFLDDAQSGQSGRDTYSGFERRWLAWRNDPRFSQLQGTATQNQDISFLRRLTEQQRANAYVGLDPNARPELLTDVPMFDSLYPPPPPAGASYENTAPCPSSGTIADRCRSLDRLLGALKTARQAAGNTALGSLLDASVDDIGGQKINTLKIQNDRRLEDDGIRQMLLALDGTIRQSVTVVATSRAGAETRRQWYLGMDNGLAFAPVIGVIFPYFGTNIYIRPINKDAPPTTFKTRFAFLAGFTFTSNLKKDGQRQQLYANDAMLVAGAGFRLTEILRLNGGMLIFTAPNNNPLIDDPQPEATPFFSLSADVDIGSILGGLFGPRPTPKPLVK